MRPYDAAIFDLDGTLIDTLTLRLRAIAACAPQALSAFLLGQA